MWSHRQGTLCTLFFLLQILLAPESIAGMTQDLTDCTASNTKTSAAACTRVMESGRLPHNQLYIGHYNRGWAYFNDGDNDKALADFDASVRHNPDYADTYYSRAVVQNARADSAAMRSDLDQYLKLKGEASVSYLNRALLFRRAGDLDQAYSELTDAERLEPGNRKVQVMRALVLSDKGEQRPARAEAEKALDAKADDASALYARALIAYRERDFAAATTDVDKALEQKQAFPAAHTLKGRLDEESGDTAGARASYRRALDTAPNSVDARAAQEEARERLSALGDEPAAEAPKGEEVVAQRSVGEGIGDCRKYIPSASVTIAVDCSE